MPDVFTPFKQKVRKRPCFRFRTSAEAAPEAVLLLWLRLC